MKKMFLAVCMLLCAGFVYAVQYENPMLNMRVPSGLEDGQMYLEFEHKFLQSFYLYPKDDFFALFNYGANIKIGLRYMIWQGLEAKLDYTSFHRAKNAGISYVLKTPQIGFNTQLDIQYYNYQDLFPAVGPMVQNFFYLLSLQSVPFLDDRIIVSLDAGYDGFKQVPGLGIGISVVTVRHVSVIGEYYPVLKAVDGRNIGNFSFGVKVETAGHQFIIRAGNSLDVGTRDMMLGAKDLSMYAGFEIMRLIVF